MLRGAFSAKTESLAVARTMNNGKRREAKNSESSSLAA